MKLIKAKATGKKLPAPKEVMAKPTDDLISQLQQSLTVKPKAKSKAS